MATPTNLPAAFTVGQVLTSTQQNDLRGAFRILQIVESANDTTLRSRTSTTFVDSGLTLNITPQATTNKILLVYQINLFADAATTGGCFRSVRGASTVVAFDNDNGYGTSSGLSVNNTFYAFDSPATVSATTYKIQFNRNQGAGTVYMNAAGSGTLSRFFAMEISL